MYMVAVQANGPVFANKTVFWIWSGQNNAFLNDGTVNFEPLVTVRYFHF